MQYHIRVHALRTGELSRGTSDGSWCEQWEHVKRAGLAPSPARASFGMAHHNDSAIVFGGVTDQRGRKDAVYSDLHNDLYSFGLKSRRWYPVQMRLKATSQVMLVQNFALVR